MCWCRTMPAAYILLFFSFSTVCAKCHVSVAISTNPSIQPWAEPICLSIYSNYGSECLRIRSIAVYCLFFFVCAVVSGDCGVQREAIQTHYSLDQSSILFRWTMPLSDQAKLPLPPATIQQTRYTVYTVHITRIRLIDFWMIVSMLNNAINFRACDGNRFNILLCNNNNYLSDLWICKAYFSGYFFFCLLGLVRFV